MFRLTLLLLLATTGSAGAVVIRDDAGDAQYRVAASEFPALVDLPTEGHGVLIAPQWVVTAAHAVAWQSGLEVVVVNGAPRAVEQVVFHEGFRKLPQALVDTSMKSGDAAVISDFLASSDDIALLKLASPVTDAAPVKVFRDSPVGKQVQIVGKGATGTGAMGHSPHGPNRTDLRRAFNEIAASEGRWLRYTFRRPPDALPLEGAAGNGDSGGPLLVAVDDEWQVAGLTSWKRVDGNPKEFCPGMYGQVNVAVHLAHYLDWIEATIATDGVDGAQRLTGARGG